MYYDFIQISHHTALIYLFKHCTCHFNNYNVTSRTCVFFIIGFLHFLVDKQCWLLHCHQHHPHHDVNATAARREKKVLPIWTTLKVPGGPSLLCFCSFKESTGWCDSTLMDAELIMGQDKKKTELATSSFVLFSPPCSNSHMCSLKECFNWILSQGAVRLAMQKKTRSGWSRFCRGNTIAFDRLRSA